MICTIAWKNIFMNYSSVLRYFRVVDRAVSRPGDRHQPLLEVSNNSSMWPTLSLEWEELLHMLRPLLHPLQLKLHPLQLRIVAYKVCINI